MVPWAGGSQVLILTVNLLVTLNKLPNFSGPIYADKKHDGVGSMPPQSLLCSVLIEEGGEEAPHRGQQMLFPPFTHSACGFQTPATASRTEGPCSPGAHVTGEDQLQLSGKAPSSTCYQLGHEGAATERGGGCSRRGNRETCTSAEGVLTCPLQCQLAHVSSQLPHAHGLGVSLDVRDCVPTACPVTGDKVRVGGLDLHHACRIVLQTCGDKGSSESRCILQGRHSSVPSTEVFF